MCNGNGGWHAKCCTEPKGLASQLLSILSRLLGLGAATADGPPSGYEPLSQAGLHVLEGKVRLGICLARGQWAWAGLAVAVAVAVAAPWHLGC